MSEQTEVGHFSGLYLISKAADGIKEERSLAQTSVCRFVGQKTSTLWSGITCTEM